MGLTRMDLTWRDENRKSKLLLPGWTHLARKSGRFPDLWVRANEGDWLGWTSSPRNAEWPPALTPDLPLRACSLSATIRFTMAQFLFFK